MKTYLKVILLGSAIMVPASVSAKPDGALISLSQINADQSAPVIDLYITETVTVKPDTAAFSTGVETSAPTAKEAIAKNTAKMQSVIGQLKALGVAERDVQTSEFSLSKLYAYPKGAKRRFRGYSVSNTVSAKLRDLSKLGDALDNLSSAGATEFYGPEFSLANPQAAEAEARDKVWATAYAQARYHAKKAGFSDAKVVRVTETVQRSERSSQREQAVMDLKEERADNAVVSEPAIQAGEISVTVEMGLSFVMIR